MDLWWISGFSDWWGKGSTNHPCCLTTRVHQLRIILVYSWASLGGVCGLPLLRGGNSSPSIEVTDTLQWHIIDQLLNVLFPSQQTKFSFKLSHHQLKISKAAFKVVCYSAGSCHSLLLGQNLGFIYHNTLLPSPVTSLFPDEIINLFQPNRRIILSAQSSLSSHFLPLVRFSMGLV